MFVRGDLVKTNGDKGVVVEVFGNGRYLVYWSEAEVLYEEGEEDLVHDAEG